MIIAGAGGHARELLGILAESGHAKGVFLFDDVTINPPTAIWNDYPVIRTTDELQKQFLKDPRFIIGVGKPALRKSLYEKMINMGGEPFSVVSPYARIGSFNVHFGEGLNIMTHAVITQDIKIGTGTLVHVNVTVHHDCDVGDFCELSPGCHLLGNVRVGNLVSIGTGAVILSSITIGNHAVIGAGAVVTKNVEGGSIVKGIPARK